MPENPLRDSATWQVGQVAEFSPETHTYTVTTSQGTLRGVPRLLDHPGDVIGLARDTRVAVHHELGFWVIAGILNEASAGEFELAPIRVTEVAGQGADNPVATPPFADARAPDAPTDVGPDDWVRHGELGQLLALLKGGSAVLRASPLAQIRAHQENDLVEVISHLYRHITAMGEAKVSQDGGRLTYTWRAGANVEHAGASVQAWTIRLDVGAGSSGDIFAFSITTPQGQTLARISISPEGRLELRGASLEVTAGAAGTTAESLAGSRTTRIGGSLTEEIAQDLSTTVHGTASIKTSKDESHLIGGSRRSFTVRNEDAFIGGVEQRKVLGGTEAATGPSALAGVYEFVNGGIELAIGNPSSGALPDARQGLQCVSYVGGLDFVLQPTALPAPQGGFNVISAQPASVNLGVDGSAEPNLATGGHTVAPLPAPFAVMKYEPWLAMMQVLLRLFDSHIHPTPKGPSGPPAVPLSPALSPLLSAIRSVRVGVGL